jgi:hemolysin III
MPQENIPLLGLRDPVSSLTHFAACLFAMFVTALLWRLGRRRGRRAQFALGAFGLSTVLLYGASATYHALRLPPERLRFFQLLDHSAIYLLIAGTYTPFLLVNLRGSWGWSLLAVIWSMAVVGILFKLWYADRFPAISVSAYVGMGWLGVIAAHQVYTHVPVTGVVWIVLGGLAYTIGVIFYACKRIPHHHVIWHLLVMAGSACHYIAVLYSVFPRV